MNSVRSPQGGQKRKMAVFRQKCTCLEEILVQEILLQSFFRPICESCQQQTCKAFIDLSKLLVDVAFYLKSWPKDTHSTPLKNGISVRLKYQIVRERIKTN